MTPPVQLPAGSDLVTRYEDLRQGVVTSAARPGQGLTVLLRQGMAAWMAACAAAPVPPDRLRIPPRGTQATGLLGEIVTLVVELVLAQHREVHP